ncbi:hypothetical protein ABE484_07395 [Pseudomonas pudica]|uniref:hypothetical protein n=1 Tax=Pseudomonas TaxID=286 RepID=UPI0015AA38BE|nr:hypothetical protein [Pseudomonas sp. B10(2017)]
MRIDKFAWLSPIRSAWADKPMTLPPAAKAMRQMEGRDFKQETPKDRFYYFETAFLYMEADYRSLVNSQGNTTLKIRNFSKNSFTLRPILFYFATPLH